MLYAAWEKIARAHAGDIALMDLACGRRWTFAQLSAAGEARSVADGPVFPRGAGSEFILDTIAAWRRGRVVCPLEPGQSAPMPRDWPPEWAHLKISSGSAGTPRMIAFTAAQLEADVNNITLTMGLRPEWPNFGAVSLAHSYGFSNLVLPLLLRGIPLILAPSRLPEVLRKGAEAFPAVTLPGVPALWRVWHEAGAIGPSIRLAISAGAPLPGALETAIFQRHGLKVHNFYGASECGGICYDDTEHPRENEDEAGAPLRNVRLEIDGEGCLLVRSEAVGETYWPEPTPALRNGVFRTSDRAQMVGGRVRLRGRRGDVINLAGQKIAPELIEQAVLRHPGARECVVFGVPDGARGEMVVACVAIGEGTDAESLKRFVSESLPSWQAPRHWWFVRELSDRARGKISRAQWRERFLAEYKP